MRTFLLFAFAVALAGCSGSSSSGTSGSSGSSGSSGTSGSSGSSGTTGGACGLPDAGPDAGVYTYASLGTYNCSVNGTALTASDGGCAPAVPACAGSARELGPADHVDPLRVAYLEDPPSSGPHWGIWATWGVHTEWLPRERYVHNLEHGGVVVLYRCDPQTSCLADGGNTCDALAQPARDLAANGPTTPSYGDRRYVVSPAADLPTTYALLAWGWRLELDTWDASAAECFARTHLARSPEDAPFNP